MKNIAVFASGSGTNAENLINYFSNEKSATITLVLSNRPDSFVIERAAKLSVKCEIFDRDGFYYSSKVEDILSENKIDLIVLAGFLWLVPASIISKYRGRIINIHPALLPSYGGKGMYGSRVHEAVIRNGEIESGITIHFVNEVYDEGDIIFQARCSVDKNDTPETLAHRIHKLEYKHFPEIVKQVVEAI